ncbi:MAG: ABC transporter ATP-binding protein [Acidobacteriota bacterium]
MDTMLEATGIGKRYEDFTLRDVSLGVRRGAITGVFGPNGAGKSTLIKVLACQVPAGAGTVRVFGLPCAGRDAAIRNRIGYVPQEPVFYMDKTVQWNTRFAAAYFAEWDGGEFYRLLDRFKVNPLKAVKHLSGGQKKLLALAMALSHRPDLLILDEPAAGLDVLHRRALLDRLRAFVADGDRAVVVASHITDGLDEIAEDVSFLHEGRVILHDDRDDLLSRWKWILYAEGARDPTVEDGLTDVRRQPYGNRGLTADFPAIRESIAPALASGDVRVENASLEDILIALVKEA